MSLRLRLTLLYSTLMGGILLVISAAVIIVVTALLFNEIDNTLDAAHRVILNKITINALGKIETNLTPTDVNSNVYMQVWGLDGELQSRFGTLPNFIDKPFDQEALHTSRPVYRNKSQDDLHIRVLSVPLQQRGRIIAILQVASSLEVVNAARLNLTDILSVIWIVAVLFSGIVVWFTLGQTLKPLGAITETVEQINRADDLSRRIPYQGPDDDEIGNLVGSFNQTLERLEALFTSQQRLLADVSHELRTPLTVIKGNVDLMRRMKSLDEESLTSIDQEAGRLTRLVGGLLLLAQAETGKLALNMKRVELDLLLTEVFQEMSILARSKVHLRLNEIDQAYINGDRDRLKQVLINLVANAIQYTPQGGEVFLSLERIGEQARIICQDTGPGIPAEDLPHIFERFYRAEKSRTRKETTGFGLGLSIANWIVERHGGRIEVNSQEGKGTTFAIWLPLYNH
ncbi:MAG TPA: HAMP domain-containing sensor histidine kinase, partial [Anaerolineales bacterium]|nr:HAMP domain-containing sensor histidine kinase [Anaerolineales bacterium]